MVALVTLARWATCSMLAAAAPRSMRQWWTCGHDLRSSRNGSVPVDQRPVADIAQVPRQW
jgi:hypothetical protein